MKRYTRDEIDTFLIAIDRNLERTAEIIIIGGTAAALAYRFSGATQDIDTANSVNLLEEAIASARVETGFEIPVGKAGVFDAPCSYEDRLVAYRPESLRKLQVKVPEAIDLILMKTIRAEEHDLQAIESILSQEGITHPQVIERFILEMKAVVKNPNDLDFNFRVMIERCFGAVALEDAERALRSRPARA